MGSDSQFSSSASSIDWSKIRNAHFVQFYNSSNSLVQNAADFFESGLRSGGAVIIIATNPHRVGILDSLQKRGLEVQKLQRDGRILAYDASILLGSFMEDGSPNESKFFESVGIPVSQAYHSWPHVRAFGEMVSILFDNGNMKGAIELEKLWNKLLKIYPLALFCAYKQEDHSPDRTESLSHVCDAHDLVIV